MAELRSHPGSAALASSRFLVSERIADLDDAAARLEQRIAEAESQRAELRERLEGAEVIRRHVLNNFQWLQPSEVDEAFQTVLSLRVDLATVEERFRELGARLTDVRAGLEVLRTVHRSLEDLGGADGEVAEESAAEGVSRFRSASRQVFQIIEEERMRIARDMHDGPAQSMANLVLQAEVLERLLLKDPGAVVTELIDFKSVVREALDETRRLIFDLRPMTLDDLGLVPTLRRFIKEYADKSGLVARFHLVGEERRLPGNYEAVLFRIVQEALTNVRKHAGARGVDVTLTLQAHRVVAVVKDDGEGFDVAATEARQGRTRHLGLISMRERADLEKGALEIRSQLGKGTEVRVTFDF
ncbi:MAG TPA: sensor histidine kinase [Candidatus Dormibacteraeota bacterium]|nr:sensor histidine kinase [Candidatus Dormibacteraeota bacterium]